MSLFSRIKNIVCSLPGHQATRWGIRKGGGGRIQNTKAPAASVGKSYEAGSIIV